ncbi:MAG: hypothetical protein FJ098_04620 [Deltaproteobacteria bacterium]|nr:hypothetical protein [Deltaproteobacteria bacterium]
MHEERDRGDIDDIGPLGYLLHDEIYTLERDIRFLKIILLLSWLCWGITLVKFLLSP